jgi:hypothetical protein
MASTAPIFQGPVTLGAAGFNWAPRAPETDEEWQRVLQDGQAGYQLGVDPIALPQTTDRQKIAAWGSKTGFPTDPGVYVRAAGGSTKAGLYINGDASITMKADGDKQLITITQDGATTEITVDLKKNETEIETDSSGSGSGKTKLNGALNGMIYSTGNITSLSGTIADNRVSGSTVLRRNAYTIAVDVTNGKDVTITDNLTYASVPDKTLDWDDPHNLKVPALGVVARNIIVADEAPANLSIHGVMLAGGGNTDVGSFYVHNWNSKVLTGNLNLLGGVVQKKRGPVGTFNNSTGLTTTGYSKHYTYDPRMAVTPPPFFPTTGNYDRLSWMRKSSGFVGR